MSDLFLLSNVHEGLISLKSQNNPEKIHLVGGKYEYYHYLCDGFDDRGWGCGYRTLQTICSWMKHNKINAPDIPTVKEIQDILVEMDDKPKTFSGSKEWIGSVEVCLVLDQLYGTPSKIVHVKMGELGTTIEDLMNHFNKFGSPVMMGGDMDCSSKGIMGIDIGSSEPNLLIVDPHYVGKTQCKEFLQKKGWVKWQPVSNFLGSSFYNLCLPQVKANCYTVPDQDQE